MSAPYDPTAEWETVDDCLRAIAREPSETHLDLLLATVRHNLAEAEYGFSADLVRESETLFA